MPVRSDKLKCIQCGYQLLGLEYGGDCPECGTPIVESLKGDSLYPSDASVIKRLRLGCRLVTTSLILVQAVWFVPETRGWLFYTVSVLAIHALGWLLLTPRSVYRHSGSERALFRLGCRIASMGLLILIPTILLVDSLVGLRKFEDIVLLVVLAFVVSQVMFSILYVAHTLKRIPSVSGSPVHAVFFATLIVMITAFVLSAIAFGSIQALSQTNNPDGAWKAVLLFLSIPITLLVGYIALFVRLDRSLGSLLRDGLHHDTEA